MWMLLDIGVHSKTLLSLKTSQCHGSRHAGCWLVTWHGTPQAIRAHQNRSLASWHGATTAGCLISLPASAQSEQIRPVMEQDASIKVEVLKYHVATRQVLCRNTNLAS